MKIKITALDKLFSQWIRERDLWICQKCHLGKNPYDSNSRMGLECSHFFVRGKWSTRYEPLNCDSLCKECHVYWQSNKDEYQNFKIKQFGKNRFNVLKIQAEILIPGKKTTYWNGQITDIGFIKEFLKSESKKWIWKFN